MSLTPKSRVIPHHSAHDWAVAAIGGDKIVGDEGYKGFRTGDWQHHWHYKQINRSNPSLSGAGAIDEMTYIRSTLVRDINSTAMDLDEMIKRLAKMEEEMNQIIEENQNEEQTT